VDNRTDKRQHADIPPTAVTTASTIKHKKHKEGEKLDTKVQGMDKGFKVYG